MRERLTIDELFFKYRQRATDTARALSCGRRYRLADEEDIVISAIGDLWEGLHEGTIAADMDEPRFWNTFRLLIRRKAVEIHRRETTVKRGGGKTRGESAFNFAETGLENGINSVGDQGPDGVLVIMLKDQEDHLLAVLKNRQLREIARLKLEGLSNDEVSRQMGVCKRTVERKLKIIRKSWWTDADT